MTTSFQWQPLHLALRMNCPCLIIVFFSIPFLLTGTPLNDIIFGTHKQIYFSERTPQIKAFEAIKKIYSKHNNTHIRFLTINMQLPTATTYKPI